MKKSPLPNILYVVWFTFYWLITAGFFTIFYSDIPEIAFKISAGVYVMTLLFSISPLAELWIRFSEGLKPPKMRGDIERLQPIFESVLENARKIKPRLSSNISLFIEENKVKSKKKANSEPFLNAFAIGWKTMVVTRDMIKSFPDAAIAGVMAHELGHFASLDTIGLLFSNTGNLLFALFIKMINPLIEYVPPVGWFFKSIEFIGKLILSPLSRRQEFSADKFAFDCGYGEELLEALKRLFAIYGEGEAGIRGFLENTHPHMPDRIARLEKYLEEYDPDISYQADRNETPEMAEEPVYYTPAAKPRVERSVKIEKSVQVKHNMPTVVHQNSKPSITEKNKNHGLYKFFSILCFIVAGVSAFLMLTCVRYNSANGAFIFGIPTLILFVVAVKLGNDVVSLNPDTTEKNKNRHRFFKIVSIVSFCVAGITTFLILVSMSFNTGVEFSADGFPIERAGGNNSLLIFGIPVFMFGIAIKFQIDAKYTYDDEINPIRPEDYLEDYDPDISYQPYNSLNPDDEEPEYFRPAINTSVSRDVRRNSNVRTTMDAGFINAIENTNEDRKLQNKETMLDSLKQYNENLENNIYDKPNVAPEYNSIARANAETRYQGNKELSPQMQRNIANMADVLKNAIPHMREASSTTDYKPVYRRPRNNQSSYPVRPQTYENPSEPVKVNDAPFQRRKDTLDFPILRPTGEMKARWTNPSFIKKLQRREAKRDAIADKEEAKRNKRIEKYKIDDYNY